MKEKFTTITTFLDKAGNVLGTLENVSHYTTPRGRERLFKEHVKVADVYGRRFSNLHEHELLVYDRLSKGFN